MNDNYEEDMNFMVFIMSQIVVYAKERGMDVDDTVRQLCTNILLLLDYVKEET